MKRVEIYPDGSCLGNPGPGAAGAILKHGTALLRIGVGQKETTNNQMELLAVCLALESLKEPCAVHITTDSEYVIGGAYKNPKTGKQNKRKKNRDLWTRLDRAMTGHTITWKHVYGHRGHKYNEMANDLAQSISARVSIEMAKNLSPPIVREYTEDT